MTHFDCESENPTHYTREHSTLCFRVKPEVARSSLAIFHWHSCQYSQTEKKGISKPGDVVK